MDLEFSPSISETQSLSTPNITNDPIVFKSSYINDDKSSNETLSTVKLTKIENELKQTFIQVRQPTESPFQKIVEAGVLTVDKHLTTDDEIPSTAEVMNVIESLAKNLSKDNCDRELDTLSTMGIIVSPKKKLLYRSQSQTDNLSTQNEEVLVDDQQQQYQRLNDIPLIDSDSLELTKGQKRSNYSSHDIQSKRQKYLPTPAIIPIRSSINEDSLTQNDDQRKQQIRDSNREAARRCRERRRQYIEQLEGNLEQYKAQIKQLNEKLIRAERENTQLRTIITETKHFHSIDFPNTISTN